MKKSIFLLSAVTFVVLARAANASPIYFTNESTFLAALTGTLEFESFEGLGSGSLGSYENFGTSGIDRFQVRETGGDPNELLRSTTAGVHDGLKSIYYKDDGTNDFGKFWEFNPDINAFGVWISSAPNTTINVSGGNGISSSISATNTPSFWGVIDFAALISDGGSDSSNSGIRFSALNPVNPETGHYEHENEDGHPLDVYVYFDAVRYGAVEQYIPPTTPEAPAVVPIPGAAGLGLLGMSLVGYLRRRKAA